MMPTFKPGHILAVRGKGFFARGILAATENTVSHFGMVTGTEPFVIVIEALLRVKTRPIEESAADDGWVDIILQHTNAIFRTTWFTDHLTFGKKKEESTTPADIYNFAENNPSIYTVTKLGLQDFTEPV